MKLTKIMLLDCGGDGIADRIREIRGLGVYCEVLPSDTTIQEIKAAGYVKGILFNCESGLDADLSAGTIGSDIYLNMNIPFLHIDTETEHDIIKEFVLKICSADTNWTAEAFIAEETEKIKALTYGKKVLLALSGGVDSSVVAALVHKAIGDKLFCVHVNTGLLRKNESEEVLEAFSGTFGKNLIYADASERFLSKLNGVADPEQKRKIIGAEFIKVFEEEAEKLDGIEFLAQGTIYPDIIESFTKSKGVVKSHHNVGGLPETMQLKLIEPIKYLFKDEVRECGRALALPENLINRQPFPGPGLGVRCLGAITPGRLTIAREADAVLREVFTANGADAWQYFAVVPEFQSVGISDGKRTYAYTAIIRAVNSIDAMTAALPAIDMRTLQSAADRILTSVPGVNRVCYDLTPKPPGTIEWE